VTGFLQFIGGPQLPIGRLVDGHGDDRFFDMGLDAILDQRLFAGHFL